jgi:hypothetical protein
MFAIEGGSLPVGIRILNATAFDESLRRFDSAREIQNTSFRRTFKNPAPSIWNLAAILFNGATRSPKWKDDRVTSMEALRYKEFC